jgi:hypothetical protein
VKNVLHVVHAISETYCINRLVCQCHQGQRQSVLLCCCCCDAMMFSQMYMLLLLSVFVCLLTADTNHSVLSCGSPSIAARPSKSHTCGVSAEKYAVNQNDKCLRKQSWKYLRLNIYLKYIFIYVCTTHQKASVYNASLQHHMHMCITAKDILASLMLVFTVVYLPF